MRLEDRVMRFIPHTRGLLEMHPSKGMTFSLDGVRNAYPGMRLVCFRTIAGVAHSDGLADIWVFVDGRVRFRRFQMCKANGPVPINVDLKPNDRFLTLASTPGGREPWGSWLLLGDPRLELAELKPPQTEAEIDLKRKEAAIP